jgi:hypothetical protein
MKPNSLAGTMRVVSATVAVAALLVGCSREAIQDAAVRMRVQIEDAGETANTKRQLAGIIEGPDEPLVHRPEAPQRTAASEAPDPTSLYAEPQTPFGQPVEAPPPASPPPSYFK